MNAPLTPTLGEIGERIIGGGTPVDRGCGDEGDAPGDQDFIVEGRWPADMADREARRLHETASLLARAAGRVMELAACNDRHPRSSSDADDWATTVRAMTAEARRLVGDLDRAAGRLELLGEFDPACCGEQPWPEPEEPSR